MSLDRVLVHLIIFAGPDGEAGGDVAKRGKRTKLNVNFVD